MKTIFTSILPALLVLLISNATIAGGNNQFPISQHSLMDDSDSIGPITKPVTLPVPGDEPYVNDIPFNTKEISAGYFVASSPKPEPEQYINDIPFETESVASRYIPLSFLKIFSNPESYVNDIPFCTERIAERYLNREINRYCCKTL